MQLTTSVSLRVVFCTDSQWKWTSYRINDNLVPEYVYNSNNDTDIK